MISINQGWRRNDRGAASSASALAGACEYLQTRFCVRSSIDSIADSMVWLEDPLCGDGAHRGVLEEEDEQAAQELAAQYTVEPEVQVGVREARRRSLHVVMPDHLFPLCSLPAVVVRRCHPGAHRGEYKVQRGYAG